MKVVFVCLGNICRSPMAEAVFRQMVKDRGLEQQVIIDADADYIIGMDSENMMNIKRMMQGKTSATIASLLSFAGSKRDIADPWYTGDFEQTYQDVCLGCEALMEEIQEKLQKNGDK